MTMEIPSLSSKPLPRYPGPLLECSMSFVELQLVIIPNTFSRHFSLQTRIMGIKRRRAAEADVSFVPKKGSEDSLSPSSSTTAALRNPTLTPSQTQTAMLLALRAGGSLGWGKPNDEPFWPCIAARSYSVLHLFTSTQAPRQPLGKGQLLAYFLGEDTYDILDEAWFEVGYVLRKPSKVQLAARPEYAAGVALGEGLQARLDSLDDEEAEKLRGLLRRKEGRVVQVHDDKWYGTAVGPSEGDGARGRGDSGYVSGHATGICWPAVAVDSWEAGNRLGLGLSLPKCTLSRGETLVFRMGSWVAPKERWAVVRHLTPFVCTEGSFETPSAAPGPVKAGKGGDLWQSMLEAARAEACTLVDSLARTWRRTRGAQSQGVETDRGGTRAEGVLGAGAGTSGAGSKGRKPGGGRNEARDRQRAGGGPCRVGSGEEGEDGKEEGKEDRKGEGRKAEAATAKNQETMSLQGVDGRALREGNASTARVETPTALGFVRKEAGDQGGCRQGRGNGTYPGAPGEGQPDSMNHSVSSRNQSRLPPPRPLTPEEVEKIRRLAEGLLYMAGLEGGQGEDGLRRDLNALRLFVSRGKEISQPTLARLERGLRTYMGRMRAQLLRGRREYRRWQRGSRGKEEKEVDATEVYKALESTVLAATRRLEKRRGPLQRLLGQARRGGAGAREGGNGGCVQARGREQLMMDVEVALDALTRVRDTLLATQASTGQKEDKEETTRPTASSHGPRHPQVARTIASPGRSAIHGRDDNESSMLQAAALFRLGRELTEDQIAAAEHLLRACEDFRVRLLRHQVESRTLSDGLDSEKEGRTRPERQGGLTTCSPLNIQQRFFGPGPWSPVY
ncbi:hypothetical protein Naga_100033g17 [Nannochloropsis gaditana]|uniref:PWWP domain-containing protein n=1 Tax=Nannochloropsis gaditana TaxID=72520 RepID=W7TTM6_9STRA|nr:hypothetical protein Naga_100033g17 [Nannochloropsis gaditana]